MNEAKCSGVPDLFYPKSWPKYEGRDPSAEAIEHVEAAKKICNGCSLKSKCRSKAIVTGETHGVWGGILFQDFKTITNHLSEAEVQIWVEARIVNALAAAERTRFLDKMVTTTGRKSNR